MSRWLPLTALGLAVAIILLALTFCASNTDHDPETWREFERDGLADHAARCADPRGTLADGTCPE